MAKSICPFFRNERHIWYSCGVANSSGTLKLDPTFKCKRYVGLVGPVDGKSMHDDVIKWKHFPRYWPFVRGIHRSPVNSRTKASDAELWCFLWSAPDKRLSKQWWGWWFETPSWSLWRHRNGQRSQWQQRSLRWRHPSVTSGTVYHPVVAANWFPLKDAASRGANSTSFCSSPPPAYSPSPPEVESTRLLPPKGS